MSRGVVARPLSHSLLMLERVRELIAHGSDPVQNVCIDCASLISEKIEIEYAWYQRETSRYAKQDFSIDEDVNIYDVLSEAQSEEELRVQLSQAKTELSNLIQRYETIRGDVFQCRSATEELVRQNESLLADNGPLAAKRDALNERLLEAQSLTTCSGKELRLLHTVDAMPLFYISTASATPTINGYPITLYASGIDDSNILKINAAWGLVGLAVASIIELHFSQDSLSPDICYKVSPLRNRVILRRIQPAGPRDGNIVYLGPPLSLESGVSDTYLEAISAILVVLAVVARKFNKLDCLNRVVRRVLDTIDKYGADVAGASFGGSFASSRKGIGTSPQVGANLELLPHWRYLFSTPNETLSDLLSSIAKMLG